MAMGVNYACSKCSFSVTTWSDGNPFYFDEGGVKQYAYHPNHAALDRCVGNDTSRFCTACGHQFIHDSDRQSTACPECCSAETTDNGDLDGRRCPRCRAGYLTHDPDNFCIS